MSPSQAAQPDYRCPGCNTESRLIIGPEQAFCMNETGCSVLSFNPSLPDGGLSEGRAVDLSGLGSGCVIDLTGDLTTEAKGTVDDDE